MFTFKTMKGKIFDIGSLLIKQNKTIENIPELLLLEKKIHLGDFFYFIISKTMKGDIANTIFCQ